MFRAYRVLRGAAGAPQPVLRRKMGGGHHAPPPEGGLDGLVRKYLPENHHVAMGVIGMYFGLYMLSKLVFGGKKKQAAVPAIAGHSHGDIPSVESPAWGDWFAGEGNAEKFFSGLEK